MKANRLVLAVVAWWLVSLPVDAQTNDDVNAGLEFNFSTPGARSLAMGGAFLGLADDATAAYTNPAGLTNLTIGGSEVSVEYRHWGYTNIYPDQGHFGGSPTGIGLDSIEGIRNGSQANAVDGLSFLSFGYVFPRGWTLALYRHQLAAFEASAVAQGLFFGPGTLNENGSRVVGRVFPTRSRLSLDIVNHGVSGSYRLVDSPRRGSLAVGFGLSRYEARLRSRTERFSRTEQDRNGDRRVDPSEVQANRNPGGFFGPADLLGDNINNLIVQEGDDSDWGINAGVLWQMRANQEWSIGATYRQGPEFATESRYIYGPASERVNPEQVAGTVNPRLGGRGVLKVPDVVGLGVAWSPREGKVRLALDYDLVRYSQMIDGLVNVLVLEEGSFRRSNYRLDDAQEAHLGLEYVFLVIEPQLVGTVRFGAWHDPGHGLEYIGPDSVLRTRFQARDDQLHLCAGLGFVIGENFQVDIALDHSDRVDTASLSLVKFF